MYKILIIEDDLTMAQAIQKEMTAEDIAIKLAELSRFFGIESAVDGAVIASVSPPLTQGVAQAVKLLYDVNALIVGPGVKSGLNIKINDPSQLGADLVGMAAGVVDQYSLPCLLVNLSDTMTISYIDENGKLQLGNQISPFLYMNRDYSYDKLK